MSDTVQRQVQTQLGSLVLEEQLGLTLEDLCRACAAQNEVLVQFIEEEVIVPSGDEPAAWRFTGVQLRRARIAVRLHRDLGVNPAGAALALQLMDEIETLRARLARMGGID